MKRPFLYYCVALTILYGCAEPQVVSNKQPDILYQSAAHQVAVGAKGQLSPGESDALSRFLAAVPPEAVNDAVLTGDRAQTQALLALEDRLAKAGIQRRVMRADSSQRTASALVTVTLYYSVAVPPHDCPDWSGNAAHNYASALFSNHGCSYYNNIAAQLADPADYDKGHGGLAKDGARESVYVERYLSGGASAASGSAGGGASDGSVAPAASTGSP